MSTNGEEPGIHVDPLGDLDPNPAFSDEDLEGGEAAATVETPPITDDEAGHLLGELIGVPFEWAGRLYAARAPQSVAVQVAAIWTLQPEESDLIGGRVWAAIPARFRETGRRALEASPAALAIGSIAQAVRRRRAGTRLLVEWANSVEDTTRADLSADPRPQPAPHQGRPAARADGDGGDRLPGAAGGSLDPHDDAAAGLGLSGTVQSGAAARRQRRHLAEAADRPG